MPQNPLAATIAKNQNNAQAPLTAGKQGDLLASPFHGTKYTLAYEGSLFVGASPSGVTLSAGLATTYVGLCLSNPAENTKNLVVRNVAGSILVAPAAVLALGLITGYAAAGIVTHTTALTPFSSLVGTGPTPTAKLDSACTLVGTPVWTRQFGVTPVSAELPGFVVEIEGAIILPPGAYCAVGANVAGSTAGFIGSIEWEEVPV